jgi:hypothetical protein
MLSGYSLKVIEECKPLEIGETVYCIEDCPKRQIIRVWSKRTIFGVNEVIFSYARRRCFKII